jgi:hypothetical protein
MSVVRLFIVALAIACSGCVPWRFSETAHIRGEVLDQTTKQPVTGARLHDKRFPEQVVTTSSDGHFDFPAIHRWSAFYLLPAPDINREWIPFHSFVIEASGYHANEIGISRSGEHTGEVIYLTPNTALEPTATAP